MVKMTWSFSNFLFKYHKDLLVPLSFGHLELMTDDIAKEYIEWCQTEEGESYLEGGSNYKKVI